MDGHGNRVSPRRPGRRGQRDGPSKQPKVTAVTVRLTGIRLVSVEDHTGRYADCAEPALQVGLITRLEDGDGDAAVGLSGYRPGR
jgi:hypothetical protein